MSRPFLRGVYCGIAVVSPSICIFTHSSAETSSPGCVVLRESYARQQTHRQGLCGSGGVSRFDGITISRSHYNTTTMWRYPTSQFGIRITTHVLPTTFVCSVPFRLERAPQESITAGCFKFEVVLPYSVRCDSEFHFQGTYVETEMPLTTASFVFYKNSAGN